MKAIILTYAPVNKADEEILKMTDILKLALNQHAENLRPDARIITDYMLKDILKNFSQKIISLRDRLREPSDRIEYFDGEFKGATILAAIDYLISKNYNEILIIGDNRVNHQSFRNDVDKEIEKYKGNIKLYQYSNGAFNLPTYTIEQFCRKQSV